RSRSGGVLRAPVRGNGRRDRRGRSRPHAARRAVRAARARRRSAGGRAVTAADPTGDELLARARALVPRLRERAERCERERRVPEESIRELKDAGLFRILQPRAYGGYEQGFAAYARVAAELGRGCASTAWVYENNAMHQLILAHFPAETQKWLWG